MWPSCSGSLHRWQLVSASFGPAVASPRLTHSKLPKFSSGCVSSRSAVVGIAAFGGNIQGYKLFMQGSGLGPAMAFIGAALHIVRVQSSRIHADLTFALDPTTLPRARSRAKSLFRARDPAVARDVIGRRAVRA